MSSNFAAGRRAGGQVNFSNFIQDLNEIPPQQEVSPSADDWEKDLAMFTNTNFMDWENSRGSADFSAQQQQQQPPKGKETKPSPAVTGEQTASNAASAFGDFDFSLPGGQFLPVLR
jgi:hypothetical protein